MATKPLRKHVIDFDKDAGDISGVRFAHLRLYLDALEARISTVEAKVDRLNTKIEALPPVLAEMLDERDKRKQ